MSCTSKFTNYVTMISNFFIVIINKFFTSPTIVTLLKQMFLFFTHDQIFVKVLFHYFFAICILLKNCFNKFMSSIFTSKTSNSLSKPIINANNLVSKTTKNMIMISFCVRTFIAFNFF